MPGWTPPPTPPPTPHSPPHPTRPHPTTHTPPPPHPPPPYPPRMQVSANILSSFDELDTHIWKISSLLLIDTHTHIHAHRTDTQMQATTISEGQNWSRVKCILIGMLHHIFREICTRFPFIWPCFVLFVLPICIHKYIDWTYLPLCRLVRSFLLFWCRCIRFKTVNGIY